MKHGVCAASLRYTHEGIDGCNDFSCNSPFDHGLVAEAHRVLDLDAWRQGELKRVPLMATVRAAPAARHGLGG